MVLSIHVFHMSVVIIFLFSQVAGLFLRYCIIVRDYKMQRSFLLNWQVYISWWNWRRKNLIWCLYYKWLPATSIWRGGQAWWGQPVQYREETGHMFLDLGSATGGVVDFVPRILGRMFIKVPDVKVFLVLLPSCQCWGLQFVFILKFSPRSVWYFTSTHHANVTAADKPYQLFSFMDSQIQQRDGSDHAIVNERRKQGSTMTTFFLIFWTSILMISDDVLYMPARRRVGWGVRQIHGVLTSLQLRIFLEYRLKDKRIFSSEWGRCPVANG
jgi:hypothetical protein